MHSLLLLGGLALSLSVDAFAVTSMPDVTPTLDARGIIPTTSGQIGVNPVEEELGEPSTYVADIGTDTGLLTLAGGTTHVGKNFLEVLSSSDKKLVDRCQYRVSDNGNDYQWSLYDNEHPYSTC